MRALLVFVFLAASSLVFGQQNKNIKEYSVEKAQQGVAVDRDHFYVINNTSITKHEKATGRMILSWRDTDSLLTHLNGGIVIDGRLYCAHSNYPASPMTSSIEIFDPANLRHLETHSFGIGYGSLTWIARHDGYWFATFAHYTGRGSEKDKDNRWTSLVKFDQGWRFIESWVFPESLLSRFEGRSSSGGVILDDGRILVTSHDGHELYAVRFPKMGSELQWEDTYTIGSYGQSISIEPGGSGHYVYGIIKKRNVVVRTELKL